jgi:hypothetical protein
MAGLRASGPVENAGVAPRADKLNLAQGRTHQDLSGSLLNPSIYMDS